MLQVSLFERCKRALFVGAHADDIEIGCGGAVLELALLKPDVEITWVVFSAVGERGEEARDSARSFTKGFSSVDEIYFEYKDGFFPYSGAQIKQEFEQLKANLRPDVIFSHCLEDAHQDHRTIAELTWNTFRDHLILEYEIPKYDGDLGKPNLFVPLREWAMNQKVEMLMKCFGTQLSRRWFERNTFTSLARIRGLECGAESGFAEGYIGRKLVGVLG
jgi:LmbE family N-acetylglucosaminyl deacetylase